MQRHGIGQQVRRASSGSTPHDHVSIEKKPSSRSPILHRPRHSTLRHPAIVSSRASVYRAHQNTALIQHSIHHLPIRCITSPSITRRARRVQIPIARAAPPHVSIPAVSSLGGFRTPALGARGSITHSAGIRNPSQLPTRAPQQAAQTERPPTAATPPKFDLMFSDQAAARTADAFRFLRHQPSRLRIPTKPPG